MSVGGWVTAGALSSVFSIINPSEDSQKGVSSMPDALSFSFSVSFTHTDTHTNQHTPDNGVRQYKSLSVCRISKLTPRRSYTDKTQTCPLCMCFTVINGICSVKGYIILL